jgi:pimeloyl-ACP methyl ester carboxylesterase
VSAAQAVRFMRDANGARVADAAVGDGPLILCPARWVSHVERDWEHPGFRHFFNRLAEGFRVVRYDRPGTGLSDRDVPPRTQACEVKLLAALADTLGEPQFSMFAISCAGPVALAYAAEHPDRIRRLCLYGSYASGLDAATPEVRDALSDLVTANWGLGSTVPAAIFSPGASAQEIDTFSRQQLEWASGLKAAELLRMACAMSAVDLLARVRAEALIIHRREDRLMPLEAARRLAASCALRDVEGQGAPTVGRRPCDRRHRSFIPCRQRAARIRPRRPVQRPAAGSTRPIAS